jgi:NAD(P)-dependent dehydrogenase (short-subunit alcohol dehydrogenase family)
MTERPHQQDGSRRREAAGLQFGFRSGDVIVVTGAGRGIGAATALCAAQQGLRVAAWDLHADAAAATAARINASGGTSSWCAADVSNLAQVRAALGSTVDDLGRVRYLVNCASPSSLDDLAFDEAIRIAVGGMRQVTEEWLQGTGTGRAVVNVSSTAGNMQGANCDWYSAAKAAVAGYTRYLAACRADQLRANAVAPGMTDTPRLHGTAGMASRTEEDDAAFLTSEVGRRAVQRVPLGRLAETREIALPILFLLSPASSFVNGALLTIDGGWTLSV